MLKKLGFAAGVLGSLIVASTVFAASVSAPVSNSDKAQYYGHMQLTTKKVSNAEHGRGELQGRMALTRETTSDNAAIKELGIMSLARGNYIGVHKQENTEEVYVILSGTGLFSDGRNENIVSEGDIMIARVGQSCGLRNVGYEPLRFVMILARNEGNPATWAESMNPKRIDNLHMSEFRTDNGMMKEAEWYAARIQAQVEADEKALADKQLAKENAKRAKEEAKEAARQAKEKAKADAIAEKKRLEAADKQRKADAKQEELDRKAMAKREKARQEIVEDAAKEAEKNARKAKNSKNAKPDDGFTRIAKADEAEWEAARRAKIKAENANELDDAFAIGKK